jgi:hypothetical protein
MRFISLETIKEVFVMWGRKCLLCGKEPVQLHHHLLYGGQQQNEPFSILPLCKDCHDRIHEPDIHSKCDWLMLCRATDEELKKYSKVENLIVKRDKLIEKYGKFHSETL